MTILADIEQAKDECLDALDDEIVAARDLKNQSFGADGVRMSDVIARLKAQRTAIATQDYKAALTDPALQNALNIIKGVTADMTAVAGNMTTATDFINNLTVFIGGGTKVVSALRGI
jgi:hypothetical protein